MKGIVLAGGTGSRLFPLTKVTNKHLLPVGRYPMIFHPIAKLAEAGVQDIMIVTGTEHMGDLVAVLGSGTDLGLEFTYRVQDRPGGIAQALGLARSFVGGEPCAVVLGDNIFSDSIIEDVTNFSGDANAAHLLLADVSDPTRFGVAQLTDNRVVYIEEKPQSPASSLAVGGVYIYGANVFHIIEGLSPSSRGELEISDVNNAFIREGLTTHRVLRGWWTDAGTFPSLQAANDLAEDLTLPLFESTRSHAAGT